MHFSPEQYLDRLSQDIIETAEACAKRSPNDVSFQSEIEAERKFLAHKRYDWVLEAFKECGVYNV